MRIGYARTSTLDQLAGFEAQLRELERCGCEKVFQEQVSSVAQRDQLEAAIEFARQAARRSRPLPRDSFGLVMRLPTLA